MQEIGQDSHLCFYCLYCNLLTDHAMGIQKRSPGLFSQHCIAQRRNTKLDMYTCSGVWTQSRLHTLPPHSLTLFLPAVDPVHFLVLAWSEIVKHHVLCLYRLANCKTQCCAVYICLTIVKHYVVLSIYA